MKNNAIRKKFLSLFFRVNGHAFSCVATRACPSRLTIKKTGDKDRKRERRSKGRCENMSWTRAQTFLVFSFTFHHCRIGAHTPMTWAPCYCWTHSTPLSNGPIFEKPWYKCDFRSPVLCSLIFVFDYWFSIFDFWFYFFICLLFYTTAVTDVNPKNVRM